MKNPINPFLWFDSQAGAAADFYAATFPGARLLGGSPLVVSVEVGELKFSLLNGGPQFKVTHPSRSSTTAAARLRSTPSGRPCPGGEAS